MRYPCEESTVDIEHGNMRIRLWINNPNCATPMIDILRRVHDAVIETHDVSDFVAVCERLARVVDEVNAVQVMYKIEPLVTVGHMIYTVPFVEAT